MLVRVRSEQVHLTLPVPLALGGFAVRLVPARYFENAIQGMTGEAFKEFVTTMLRECRDIAREYRGLEVVQVAASDGTFVSVTL